MRSRTAPRPKRRKEDGERSNPRPRRSPPLVIVTLAGHVDHGKTSLVKALTGVDTDRLAEEKRRGLTIDLGFAYADLEGQRVGFVDVPGHHRFVHNMVAGVAGQQHALLVVAADDGVMPQSHEHLQILRLLGLANGVVALTKTDRVNEDRATVAREEIGALVAGSFLEGAEVIPVSCVTGSGVATLRQTLAQAAAKAATKESGHAAEAPVRLAVDRAFPVRGSGLVATGTVVAGTVRIGDQLALASNGKTLRVRGLRVQDRTASAAATGDRAAVNLAGARQGEVGRGDWLIDPAMREPATRFALRLQLLDDFPRKLRHNAPVHVHHATSHSHGRVLLIDGAGIEPGGEALVDVLCETPLHVKVGDRLVLRDHDRERTLGGGQVHDLAPVVRRRSARRRARLAAIAAQDAGATLAAQAGMAPVPAAAFTRQWNLHTERMATLAQGHGLALLNDHWLHPSWRTRAIALVRDALAAHHRAQPDSDGLTAAQVAATITELDAEDTLLALQAAADAGTLRHAQGRYRLATHRAVVPAEAQRAFDSVSALLDSRQPPSLGDLAKRLKRPFAELEAMLRPLPGHGFLVRVSDNRYFLPARLRELAAVATDLAAKGPFTVRQFRDATGIGRNVVIDVLEHFDGVGFTRRQGDTRWVAGDTSLLA